VPAAVAASGTPAARHTGKSGPGRRSVTLVVPVAADGAQDAPGVVEPGPTPGVTSTLWRLLRTEGGLPKDLAGFLPACGRSGRATGRSRGVERPLARPWPLAYEGALAVLDVPTALEAP
jgi:hypothetical protein